MKVRFLVSILVAILMLLAAAFVISRSPDHQQVVPDLIISGPDDLDTRVRR